MLIEGPPGSGKSSLALALIDRGATLVGDDGVLIELREGRLWALPPPAIAGLIEIRNVGLVTLPAAPAPLALALRLDDAAPRYVEAAERVALAGGELPLIRLWPGARRSRCAPSGRSPSTAWRSTRLHICCAAAAQRWR